MPSTAALLSASCSRRWIRPSRSASRRAKFSARDLCSLSEAPSRSMRLSRLRSSTSAARMRSSAIFRSVSAWSWARRARSSCSFSARIMSSWSRRSLRRSPAPASSVSCCAAQLGMAGLQRRQRLLQCCSRARACFARGLRRCLELGEARLQAACQRVALPRSAPVRATAPRRAPRAPAAWPAARPGRTAAPPPASRSPATARRRTPAAPAAAGAANRAPPGPRATARARPPAPSAAPRAGPRARAGRLPVPRSGSTPRAAALPGRAGCMVSERRLFSRYPRLSAMDARFERSVPSSASRSRSRCCSGPSFQESVLAHESVVSSGSTSPDSGSSFTAGNLAVSSGPPPADLSRVFSVFMSIAV